MAKCEDCAKYVVLDFCSNQFNENSFGAPPPKLVTRDQGDEISANETRRLSPVCPQPSPSREFLLL
jgi:hypothetical protein